MCHPPYCLKPFDSIFFSLVNHCLHWTHLPSLPHLLQILKPSSAHSPAKERSRGKSLSPRRRQATSPQRRACRRDKSWVLLHQCCCLHSWGTGWRQWCVIVQHRARGTLTDTHRKAVPGILVVWEAPEARSAGVPVFLWRPCCDLWFSSVGCQRAVTVQLGFHLFSSSYTVHSWEKWI